MKGRPEESSNWNLKQGRKKRWWTANKHRLYLVPHSTCTPCGWVPHFHKSLGLHLTREREKKKGCCRCLKIHKAWRILHHGCILEKLQCGYTWHFHSHINVLYMGGHVKKLNHMQTPHLLLQYIANPFKCMVLTKNEKPINIGQMQCRPGLGG